jgi:AraC-like DNA-binding protein
MFQFIYNDKDYMAILQKFAAVVGAEMRNNKFIFTPEYGSGVNELIVMPDGLQACLLNYTINQDLFLKREKTKEEFYTLRFDEVIIKDSLTVKFDDEETFSEHNHIRAAALLTSSLFDFSYFGKKGSSIRGINILLTREWLAKYLDIQSVDEVLHQYLALKSASFNFEPLDAGYRKLINEIMDDCPGERSPMNIIMVQNRIMMLVERFFTRLHEKMKNLDTAAAVDNDEIQRIMDAEALLVKDFSVPAPTIAELARHTAMSETKFKNQFRKIYQSGPYEYFQKNRMERAKYLLLTRNYSVKETGQQLGFNNLSNFTIAFKKEFGVLPSEV